MDPSAIRSSLERCGFAVARKPYHGQCHHCRRDGQDASVDLQAGRVKLWGTKRELSIEEISAEFGGGDVAATHLLRPGDQAWLDRCVRAGFRITDGPRPPVANVTALHSGTEYVLLPWTRSILSVGFASHFLSEFEAAVAPASGSSGVAKQLGIFDEE